MLALHRTARPALADTKQPHNFIALLHGDDQTDIAEHEVGEHLKVLPDNRHQAQKSGEQVSDDQPHH